MNNTLELVGARFNNTYQRLPEYFYSRLSPTPVTKPSLVAVNPQLVKDLGLSVDQLTSPQGLAMLAGNSVPKGASPIAQAYAGHQFGSFNPQLGDGRAILLGELEPNEGPLVDMQLKGSGPTPYSRGGDGRAALGPVIREYIISEAMWTMGIKTTRALAAVTTGDRVNRQQSMPGAVLTRIASSHIRIGTFEYFRAQGNAQALQALADYVINRHYPQALHTANPYVTLLENVLNAQASLIASWLNCGFIHGVMNTDNMTISGETIDYGPCAFLNSYQPDTVFSSIDHGGRYAYANQKEIGLWNLTRLAECLLPLIDTEMSQAIPIVQSVLETYTSVFDLAWYTGMAKKIGLDEVTKNDRLMIQDLLQLMQKNKVDFTLTFRYLADYLEEQTNTELINLFSNSEDEISTWLALWQQRLANQQFSLIATKMRTESPMYIPRNHVVEHAISAAVEDGDLEPFHALHKVLQNPFKEQPGMTYYAQPPEHDDADYKTFCGT